MKTFILSICSILSVLSISAQTYYYDIAKTFYENGYTYQCDVPPHKLVELYNKSNKYTYAKQVNRYTGKSFSIEDSYKNVIDYGSPMSKCYSIVNNAFSSAEKQRIKEDLMTIDLFISPDTGKVLEVKFRFLSYRPFATIPVSIYRKIEMELKKEIYFIPTAEGKKRNYLYYSWNHRVE